MKKTSFIVGITAAIALIFSVGPAYAQLTSTNFTRGDGFTVVEFTAGSGTWTVPDGVLSLEVLVVGGGGSGSYWGYNNAWPNPSWGGGGGGGGFYYTASYTPSGGSVTVTVGPGGAAGNTGTAGSQSVFDSLIAYGGAGSQLGTAGSSGGNNQGGTGYAGGANSGGGGGAGQAGQDNWFAAPNNNGGNGLANAITGTSTYYGGGGASFYNGSLGGLGGGGSTDDSASPYPGMQNGVDGLGGGGAGGRNALSDVGSGGSGIVIVAYQAVAIPEPSTWLLVGLGLVPLFFRRSRKQS